MLIELGKNEDDRESLCQADGLLHQLKLGLESKLGTSSKRKPQYVSNHHQSVLRKASNLNCVQKSFCVIRYDLST